MSVEESVDPVEEKIMKILRDESGNVLILPSPWGARVRSASPQQSSLEVNKAVPGHTPAAAAHTATQHCRFYCRWCESPLTLPHDNMGSPFGSPYTRRIEVRAIASVCGNCNHVGGFSLFRGGYGYDTRNNLVSAVPHGKTILLDWLRCTEDTCSFPLPLFVTLNDELTAENVKEVAKGWLWDDLTCTSGHCILPRAWMFDRNAGEFPAALT
jgi:hypothetical protein